MASMIKSRTRGKLIQEKKNLKSKNSCQTPIKMLYKIADAKFFRPIEQAFLIWTPTSLIRMVGKKFQ
jgi:hypothetical protein